MINDEKLWNLYEAMKRTDDAFGKETALRVAQVLLNNILGEPKTVAIDCHPGVCVARLRKEKPSAPIPRTCPTCGLGPCKQGY